MTQHERDLEIAGLVRHLQTARSDLKEVRKEFKQQHSNLSGMAAWLNENVSDDGQVDLGELQTQVEDVFPRLPDGATLLEMANRIVTLKNEIKQILEKLRLLEITEI